MKARDVVTGAWIVCVWIAWGVGVSAADEGHPTSGEPSEEVAQESNETKTPSGPMCTYNMNAWNTRTKSTTNKERIEKPYADITGDERSPEDPRCTVCEQDQVTIKPAELGIKGVDNFKVCRHYAPKVEEALKAVAASSFRLDEITGYRPGRTRGKVVDGLRTELSNHAYGTAIDINADYNGLYNKCDVAEVTPKTIEGCVLGVGGDWDPKKNPKLTVVKGGAVYKAFTEIVGWKWGGEISGSTRDLMHFSLTGY